MTGARLPPGARLRAALALLDAGSLDDAEAHLRQILAEHPHHEVARARLDQLVLQRDSQPVPASPPVAPEVPRTITTPPGAIIRTLISPAFRLDAPDIRHKDLMPQEILGIMEQRWAAQSFAEREVHCSFFEIVTIINQGLAFDAADQVLKGSITQHSRSDVERG